MGTYMTLQNQNFFLCSPFSQIHFKPKIPFSLFVNPLKKQFLSQKNKHFPKKTQFFFYVFSNSGPNLSPSPISKISQNFIKPKTPLFNVLGFQNLIKHKTPFFNFWGFQKFMPVSSTSLKQKSSEVRSTENGTSKIPFRNSSSSVLQEEKSRIEKMEKEDNLKNEFETVTETEKETETDKETETETVGNGQHGKVPADLGKVFGHLGLRELQDKVKGVRVRQHANPLSSSSMQPVEIPNWKEIFEDPSRPLFLDIGCGSGRFLLALAKLDSENRNFLGLEIRQKFRHFLFANANVSLAEILSSYPGPLHYVTILCPDPHFKVRHRKRRVVQPALVETIAKNLVTKGQLYVASDVEEVAKDMRNQIEAFGNGRFFERKTENGTIETDGNGWLKENPLEVPTEREVAVFTNGGSMYRALYTKV